MKTASKKFFSRIRGFGTFYNNPSPFEVRNRIRLLILTGNTSDIPLSINTSVAEEIQEPCADNEDLEKCSNFVSNELCRSVVESSQPTNEDENEVQQLLSNDFGSEFGGEELETDVQLDALKYIAGYVAFKCQNVDETLGECRAMSDLQNVRKDWISVISRGGLVHPTIEWMHKVKQFEILFSEFHGQHVSKCRNVIRTLTTMLQDKFPDCNKKAIHLFVKTRTFIRIRHLNQVMKFNAMRKYAAKKNLLWLQSSGSKK